MKVLVVSDSHGNITNLKHVIGFGKKIGVKAVIHAGDWDNIESIETVLSFGIPLYTVLGNADIDFEVEEYLRSNAEGFDPIFLKFEMGGRKISVIHKVNKGDKRFEGSDVVFSGHYHSFEQKMVEFMKFVRPGAIINGNNFAVYETETNEVESFEDGQN